MISENQRTKEIPNKILLAEVKKNDSSRAISNLISKRIQYALVLGEQTR